MSVTLQLAKPESLQRTGVLDGALISWNWLQWIITLWRILNYIKIGTGTPEATVSAPVGTLFLRLDGGASTVLYVKETGGASSAGWAAK